MLHYMFMPYRRYFDFKGRSCRREFWWFFAFVTLVIFACYALYAAVGALDPSFDPDRDGGAGFYVVTSALVIFAVATIIPGIAVEVRRWHDQDKSGWFWFVRLIPGVGGLIVLVFMLLKGNTGSNRFGPDPRDPTAEEVFA